MIDEFGAARSVYPVYVAAMMVVDVFCNTPAMGRRLKLSPWLLFAFIAVAIAVFVIAVQHH